jgi:predicted ATPase
LVAIVEGWSKLGHPLLLVIEDLHWSDTASMDVIEALVERSSRIRLMLLLTLRPVKHFRWNVDGVRIVELRLTKHAIPMMGMLLAQRSKGT